MISRRRFLGAVLSGFAAPSIVRASSLMPVRNTSDWHYLMRMARLGIPVIGGTYEIDRPLILDSSTHLIIDSARVKYSSDFLVEVKSDAKIVSLTNSLFLPTKQGANE